MLEGESAEVSGLILGGCFPHGKVRGAQVHPQLLFDVLDGLALEERDERKVEHLYR